MKPSFFISMIICSVLMLLSVRAGEDLLINGEFKTFRGEKVCHNCDLEGDELQDRNWGAPAYGRRLSLIISNPLNVVGAPIVAFVAMQNVAKRNLGDGWDSRSFMLRVLSSNNIAVPLTELGTNQAHLVLFNPRDDMLFAGQLTKSACRLDELYDLKRPGKYFVTAQAYFEITSNIATIEVIAVSEKKPNK